MARLNTRPSITLQSCQASTALYTGDTSDQENQDPATQPKSNGMPRSVTLTRSPSLPASSQDGSVPRSEKRKRVGSTLRDLANEEDGRRDDSESADESNEHTRYFDPDQDAEQRRAVKRRFRNLERNFQDNRDDLLRESTAHGLKNTLDQANKMFEQVKQTTDATVDSRLLVGVSDIAYKKTAQLVLGDTSAGIDVDEFLSKCITFMRNGGPLAADDSRRSSSRRRTSGNNIENSDSEDEADGDGEALDWETLGRHACYPYNARPAVPSFLLGPLSVEKKQRKETQRRVRNARDNSDREMRPEELSRDALQQSDESGLAAICTRLFGRLKQHIATAEASLGAAGITSYEQLQTPEGQQILRENQFTDAGGVSLFHFALNPNSFGQTVENLFYVSFLVKEGNIGITTDSTGLPTIMIADEQSLEEKRRNEAKKHQAVFSLDYRTWQSLVDALEIDASVIPHRDEDEASLEVNQTGWYT